MPVSPATRFALIDQKLDQIQKELSSFARFIEEHDTEHKAIAELLAQQKIINIILSAVGGSILTAVIFLVFKVFGG